MQEGFGALLDSDGDCLSLEAQFSRFERMLFSHGVFRPVQAIENELPEKRKPNFSVESKMLFDLRVHQKEMVTFGFTANVDIFTHLDVAFRAQDDRPTISPGTQTVRCESIHPEVGGRTIVSDQRSVPKIFEFRVLLICVISHTR